MSANDWRLYDDSWAAEGCTIIIPDPPFGTAGRSGRISAWVKYIGHYNDPGGLIPGGPPDQEVYGSDWPCQLLTAPLPQQAVDEAYTETVGPLRLGVSIRLIGSPQHPDFWTNYQITYSWWADGYTSKVSTCGGVGLPVPLYWLDVDPGWSTHQDVTLTPAPYTQIALSVIEAASVATDPATVAVTSWIVDGATVDASEYGSLFWPALSNIRDGSDTAAASAPYRPAYNLDVTRFGGSTTGAHLLDTFVTPIQLHSDGTQKTPQSLYLLCPYAASFVVPVVSWETHLKTWGNPLRLNIDPGWAATNPDIPLDLSDLRVPIWMPPGRGDPASGGATYMPVTVVLAELLSVEFPSGARASHWTVNNPAYGSVVEHTTYTVLTVTDARAVFTRTFVTPWRAWTSTPWPNGIDAYEVTKRFYFGDTGQDVFGWESYGWLRVDATAPADCTPVLAVAGVDLEVSDNHLTGAARGAGYSQTEHAFSYTYSIPLASGVNSAHVDLLFPLEGGPEYPGRVDSLTISGLPTGNTTLTDLLLETREQGYVKNDYGPPVQRGDYSALHASQDGAGPMRLIPDEAQKPGETGTHPPYGGALRYVEILTGAETGTILDTQYILSTFADKWNRLEGWDVAYSSADYDAANRDTFGTALNPELAQWFRPIAPHTRYTPGIGYLPPCGPVVREVNIPQGLPVTFYTRWPIWGAIEVLVSDNGLRAAPGLNVEAYRTDTGATEATGVTDSSGYVTLSPVPANGVRLHDVRLF